MRRTLLLTEIENMCDCVGVRYFVFEQGDYLLLLIHQVNSIYHEKLRLAGLFLGPECISSFDGTIDERCNPTEDARSNGLLRKKLVHSAPAD